jgi:hypothetical protein
MPSLIKAAFLFPQIISSLKEAQNSFEIKFDRILMLSPGKKFFMNLLFLRQKLLFFSRKTICLSKQTENNKNQLFFKD